MFLILAVISTLAHAAPTTSSTDVERRRLGAWTLRITHDRFRDDLACRLSADRAEYSRGALVIHLPRDTDTEDAAYRVDDGDPVKVATERSDMAHRGFALELDDLANPSGGRVLVPERRLADAHMVTIQASPLGKAVAVKIDGFSAALAVARAAGCSPAAFDQTLTR
jgi:hypothetical protein